MGPRKAKVADAALDALSSQCRRPAELNQSRLVLVKRQAELGETLLGLGRRRSAAAHSRPPLHNAHRMDLASQDHRDEAPAGPRAAAALRTGAAAGRGRLFGGGSVDLR